MKYVLKSLKGLFLAHSYLIFLCVPCFFLYLTLELQPMLVIILLRPPIKSWNCTKGPPWTRVRYFVELVYSESSYNKPRKNHLLASTNKKRGIETSNSKCEEFLRIKIDCKVIFDSHVKSLRKKTSQKLKPLSRVPCQLDLNQRKLPLNAFITSQFTYVTGCVDVSQL